jgi:hypothetical protein
LSLDCSTGVADALIETFDGEAIVADRDGAVT